MSLFDTIKYPISDPPTEEELRALPVNLFNQWIYISGWPIKNYALIAEHYRKLFSGNSSPLPYYPPSLKVLRKMIAELP